MSIEALSWGIKQNTQTPTSKLVLLVLCNYANVENICFPSEKHLSKICGVSERSIRRCIKILKETNLIKVQARNFNSNEYEILCKTNLQQDTNVQINRTPMTNNTKEQTKELYGESFDKFWKLYPRKVNKFESAKVFGKMKKEEIQSAMKAVKNFREVVLRDNVDQQFIPHATTWLRQKRYLDYISHKVNTLNSIAG
tara:strand:- start:371 stop:961 length:591 start_codon:yes stop_codon:yes gene_type:complete